MKGCHDEVGHLGLECMLDLMCDHFFWPCMAAQAREHVDKCYPCLIFKVKQPRAPLENTVAIYPLELVHLNYLCLDPGKGKEENVPSGNRPLHLICPGICNPITDCPNNR